MKLKLSLLLLLIFSLNNINAQDYPDYLINENGIQFSCKIKEIKNRNIKYYVKGNSLIITKPLINFKGINLTDTTALKNTLGTKITKPKPGYAHVYIYNGKRSAFKISYNDKELVKIKGGRFYLHEVKANTLHTYKSTDPDNSVEVNAESGAIYFIKGKQKTINTLTAFGNSYADVTSLILDNSKISEYIVLSMKKKAH